LKLKKTTSFLISFLLLINMLISGSIKASAATVGTVSKIYYSLDSSSIIVGQTFNIYVNSEYITDLYGASVDFKYDATMLQILDITEGDVFKDSSKTYNPVVKTSIPDSTGIVSMGLALQGSVDGFNATGKLFIIKAKALKTGSFDLQTTTDSSLLDTNGLNMCVKLADSTTGGGIGGVTYETENVSISPVSPTNLIGTLSGTSSVLNWTQHTDADVTKYNIYRSDTSGSNYQLLTTVSRPTITYTDKTVLTGSTYYYVISAVSSTGIESPKSNQVSVVIPVSGGNTQIFQETNSNIAYTGTWASGSLSSFSGGTAKSSNVTNSSSEFTFTGTGIKWVSYLSSNRGKANVYIDGILISTVDTYSALVQAQKVAFEKLDLSSGSHKIKIVVAGTRNSSSTGNYITADAFVVLLPASAPTGFTGTLSGTSSVLNWTQHTDADVTKYNIYRSDTSGSNYQLLTTVSRPTITYTDKTVLTGSTYYYVISAVSSTGIESPKSNQVSVVIPVSGGNTQIFQETNSNIAYTGTWASGSLSSFSGGTAKSSNVTNSSSEFTFTGTGIKWVSYLSSNRGKANVYIDGILISTVDTYSALVQAQKVAFEKLDLSSGSHKIKIVVAGTRNSSSTGNYITVDAFDVVPLSATQIFEETNSNIVYTGTWASGSLSSFSGGTGTSSNVTNSSSAFTFTGTGIKWVSYLSSNRGKANVYIDDILISTVDTYSALAQSQKVAFEKLDLSSGSHKIKIVVAGTKNSASTGNYITVDSFTVLN